jgi:hypothetical protein
MGKLLVTLFAFALAPKANSYWLLHPDTCRIGNILTQEGLKEYLRILVSLGLVIFDLLGRILMISEGLELAAIKLTRKKHLWLKLA